MFRTVSRDHIVAVARKYLDTPFAPKGRMLGIGLDCVGLPLMVAGELALVDKSGMPLNGGTYSTYSDQPVGNYVYEMCMKHLVYKPVREMLPGDVLCISVVSAPCHVAIASDDAQGLACIIHAYSGGARKVVEHPLDKKWQRRVTGCFKFPEVRD